LIGKYRGNRPLGRKMSSRWENNIKMDLRKVGVDFNVSGMGPVGGLCEHQNAG
jgi:hypothetical protein